MKQVKLNLSFKTPETERAEWIASDSEDGPIFVVDSTFARKLERECGDLRRERDKLKHELQELQTFARRLERERNELREMVYELTNQLQENGIIGYTD